MTRSLTTTTVWILAATAIAWVVVVRQASGMQSAPGTMGLGVAAYLGLWVVMMAAMMLPSVAPTIALYARMTRQRSPLSPLLCATGYLITWAGAGVLAFAIERTVDAMLGDILAWHRAGRGAAGATLILAAVYQLTPLKDVCLGKCRRPWDSSSGLGVTGEQGHCSWAPRTAPGASAVAGRSWKPSSHRAS